MKRIYFGPGECYFQDSLEISGIGVKEPMPSGFVHRPLGMNFFLMVHFHSAGCLDFGNGPETVGPNTTVFWRPGQAHHFGHASRRWIHSWILVRGPMAGRVFNAAGIPPQTVLSVDGDRTVTPFLEMMYEELIAHSPAHSVILECLLEMMAVSVGRALGEASENRAIPERLRTVRRYMDTHFHRQISLAELAHLAGFSPSHFSALFTKYYGVAPLHHVEQQRMKLAAFLLTNRQLAVYEVAERVGYSNPLYFSRRFSKRFGQSPSAFRQHPGHAETS